MTWTKLLTKLAAMLAIGGGGALTGIMGGWNSGPVRLELNQDELALLGAAGGVLLAAIGCYLASEYADARAKNQMYLRILKRLAGLHVDDHPDEKQAISKSQLRVAS